MIEPVPQFEGVTCTFNTTEDCNLRCKYCYEINKKPRNLDFSYAKKFIDLIVDHPEKFNQKTQKLLEKGIIMDFIGGDSLMDPLLLSRIIDYFATRILASDMSCKNRWRISISTNGTLFEREDVRHFCEEYHSVMSLGVSIDGCPELHDLNRVDINGNGTMSRILKWWPWYREWFPIESKGTKSTLAKSSIPYIFKSLKWMKEELGLKWINQNFIMEDSGCTEEDYKLFDSEMEKCVNYILEDPSIYWGMIGKEFLQRKEPDAPLETIGRCGSGCMPTLSIDGLIYPCFRWLPHTQKTADHAAGNVETGEMDSSVFEEVVMKSAKSYCTREEKCKTCIYEPACSYCIGGCYAEYGDFIRTTHICEITKIQCKWAEYYWRNHENTNNA